MILPKLLHHALPAKMAFSTIYWPILLTCALHIFFNLSTRAWRA